MHGSYHQPDDAASDRLAGLNLAMLIEAEMQRGMLKGDELEEDLMNAAKDGVRNIRKIMKERKGL